MEMDQLFTEIRDLSDRLDRLEIYLEEAHSRIAHVTERAIPASVADVKHIIHGHSDLIVNQAGTVAKLAQQLAYLTDQVQVIERAMP